jgi:hypothetical protein
MGAAAFLDLYDLKAKHGLECANDRFRGLGFVSKVPFHGLAFRIRRALRVRLFNSEFHPAWSR